MIDSHTKELSLTPLKFLYCFLFLSFLEFGLLNISSSKNLYELGLWKLEVTIIYTEKTCLGLQHYYEIENTKIEGEEKNYARIWMSLRWELMEFTLVMCRMN